MVNIGRIILLISLISSIFGCVLAAYLVYKSQSEEINEPLILGVFTVALNVYNVKDLYSWEAVILFDPTELKVLKVSSGGFVGERFLDNEEFNGDSIFVYSTDSFEGGLIIYGGLVGNVSGKSGNGTLAYIVFGYFNEAYCDPYIVREHLFETFLKNSNLSDIPFVITNSEKYIPSNDLAVLTLTKTSE